MYLFSLFAKLVWVFSAVMAELWHIAQIRGRPKPKWQIELIWLKSLPCIIWNHRSPPFCWFASAHICKHILLWFACDQPRRKYWTLSSILSCKCICFFVQAKTARHTHVTSFTSISTTQTMCLSVTSSCGNSRYRQILAGGGTTKLKIVCPRSH